MSAVDAKEQIETTAKLTWDSLAEVFLLMIFIINRKSNNCYMKQLR